MSSIEGNRLNNMFQDLRKNNLTAGEFNQLVNKAKEDGKIDVDEANVLINAAYVDGSVSGTENKAMIEIGKNLSKSDYTKLDNMSNRVKKYEQGEPIQGNISFLIEKGMKARETEARVASQNLQQQRQDEGTLRSMSRGIAQMPGVGGLWQKAQGLNEQGDTDEQIATAKQQGNVAAAKISANAALTYSAKTEADRGDCVAGALNKIKPRGENWDLTSIRQGVEVTTDRLKQITGHTWGQTSIDKLQPGMNNKTLILDGGHAYQLTGVDKAKGMLSVVTPTGERTTIPMNNPSLRAFVMDAAQTGTTASRADRVVHDFSQLKNDKTRAINTYDKTNGQTNAGWETRKLLIFMSDPKMAKQFDEFKNLASGVKNGGDTTEMTKFLQKIGIDTSKFDRDKIVGMSNSLLTNIPGGYTLPNSNPPKKVNNMMEAFDWINNGSPSTLTKNQTNVMSGLEYSNVDLRNYFNANRGFQEKALDMKDNLDRLLKCLDGC